MATATSPDKENREDNFQLELSRVRNRIESVFKELVKCLESQKKDLLNQLDDILIRYNSYTCEIDEQTKRKIELQKLSLQNQGQFSNSVKPVQNTIMKLIDEEIETIIMPVRPKLVSFVCDEKKLLTEVNKLFKLEERVSEIGYKNKTQSIINVCDKSSRNEQLNSPHGVAVDHNTGNIYVVDHSSNCVKAFDSTAQYLFKFGNGTGKKKMSYPDVILICGNKVLVTQGSGYIQVYQLDGKFLSRIGSHGNGEFQFNYPSGLSTDEYNGDIYICDYGNNRIQIISKNFRYKSEFGKDILHYPRDIKLYKDKIFILDQSNPCLHLFNKDLVLQKSVVTRGEGQEVINPWFFLIDKIGSILISDRNSNSILFLNSEFESIREISVSNHPMGITMDEKDRVIVVSQTDKDCLQIL